MVNSTVRTDLALENCELLRESGSKNIEGVEVKTKTLYGNKCHIVKVSNINGAKALGKPVGAYYTLEISKLLRRESDAFGDAVLALSSIISNIIQDNKIELKNILVVCLGNSDITPDALGPLCAGSLLVTRHLKYHMPEDFAAFSPVSVLCPGVLGTSGIESADYIKYICKGIRPDLVIAVDALAARSYKRLLRTVQISDAGIVPGSGVGNSRMGINRESLNIPVIAIGVPTVIDVHTLLSDCKVPEPKNFIPYNMFVTPQDIDTQVACTARLIAYSINTALHRGISLEDIDMLIG